MVKIHFEVDDTSNYVFNGLVTGKEENGKLFISPKKLFQSAFGFELPPWSKITIL